MSRQGARRLSPPPGGSRGPIPGVRGVGRAAGSVAPTLASRCLVPELLGRHDEVMRITQVPRVAVLIAPALGQRHHMVDAGRLASDALSQAHLT